MKALSLRQPWAWAILHAGKRVENRTWKCGFRGPFLIHAAKGCTREEYEQACAWMVERGLISWPTWTPDGPARPPDLDDLPRGGIVGRARIVDLLRPCAERAHPDLVACDAPCTCGRAWHMGSQYGYVLDDVVELPFTPARGLQRFFDLDEPQPATRTRVDVVDRLNAPLSSESELATAAGRREALRG